MKRKIGKTIAVVVVVIELKGYILYLNFRFQWIGIIKLQRIEMVVRNNNEN